MGTLLPHVILSLKLIGRDAAMSPFPRDVVRGASITELASAPELGNGDTAASCDA